MSQEVNFVDGQDKKWIDDWYKHEVEFDDKQQQSYEEELSNLRVLEWLIKMTSDTKENSMTNPDVDRESMKYKKNFKHDHYWAAQ